MNNLKRILFPLISAFLAYRSIELLTIFTSTTAADISYPIGIALAFLLNLFVTGIFAFIGFAYPTSRILPGSYYRIDYPQTLKAVYRSMGGKYFKVLLLLTFWGKEKNRKRYFNGTRAGISNFDFQTRQSEFGHVGAFVALLGISLWLVVQGHIFTSVVTTIINVLANFYPILLQRIHRIRLSRVTGKITLEHGPASMR
jgi:hypothetical protein